MGNHILIPGDENTGNDRRSNKRGIVFRPIRNCRPSPEHYGGSGNFAPSYPLYVSLLGFLLVEEWGGDSKPGWAKTGENTGGFADYQDDDGYLVAIHLVHFKQLAQQP